MVANQGKITGLGVTGGLRDGTDKIHSGLFKALFNASMGSRIVSGPDLTLSSGNVVMDGSSTDIVYRTQGAKHTITTNQSHAITAGDSNHDRYDLVFIDHSAGAMDIANGTAGASPSVADIDPADVPIALIKVAANAAADASHDIQLFMSTFDKDALNDDEVATAKIADDAVTYAKIQNVSATNKILGRSTAGAGVIEEIDCTATARSLLDDTSTTAMRTTLGLGTAATSSSSDFLQVSSNFTDVADKSAAYKRLVGNATLTALGSSLVGTDEVLIRDVSESNVEVKPKTVTAQTIADLYSESDTLADVTGRGASTTTALTLGEVTLDGFINNGETEIPPINPATSLTNLALAGFNDTAYYINATVSLADGTNGQIVHIKNVALVSVNINTTSVIDGSGSAPDIRRSSSTQITLDSMESITLQFVTGVTDVGNGWYILDTNSTDLLTGTLDTNGNGINFDDATGIQDSNSNEQLIFQETSSAVNYLEITNAATTNDPKLSAAGSDTNVGIEIETKGTGGITLDGDVTVDTGHTFSSTRLPTVSVSASTTLTEGTHAGRYLICAGNVTLPSTSSAGEHYTILNTTSGDITVGRNTNDINGASSDVTVGTYNAVTCIAIGSNDWIALGV